MKYKRYLSLITQSETNKWYFINMSTGTIIYDTCTSNHVDMREREREIKHKVDNKIWNESRWDKQYLLCKQKTKGQTCIKIKLT